MLSQDFEKGNLEKIDFLTNSLISELIANDWSINKLYELVDEDLLKSHFSIEEDLNILFNQLQKEKERFLCLFIFQ